MPKTQEIPAELAKFPLFSANAKFCKSFKELYDSWKTTHQPAIDVDKELARAHDFALEKKAKGHPYKDYIRFLGGWMRRGADWVAQGKKAPARQRDSGERFRA